MKIVKILGGLGNQMFQFSFFLFLKSKGVKAKLDISDFHKYGLHNGFELASIFNVIKNEFVATEVEINTFKDQSPFLKIRKLLDKVFFKSNNLLVKNTHWIEPKYSHFYSEIHNSNQTYLDGYWQNENYINTNDHLIRNSFKWQTIDERNIKLSTRMALENSVSIHIRRLDNPGDIKQLLYTIKLRLFWRIASREYYLKAIEYFNNKLSNPIFYIFTDNINWVRKNIPIHNNYIITEWNRGYKSNQDMYLMTQCKHNIISMSSFSWWGAWLNKNTEKIVIAPKKWAPRFSSKDEIIPKKWIRL